MLFSINSQNPQMRLIKKAADILREGGIIIYPTDTVYGLGCDLSNKKGIEKIYELKKRNRKQPLSFVCSDLKHISQYAKVTDYAYKTMKRLLPGAYSGSFASGTQNYFAEKVNNGYKGAGQSDLSGSG
jgi:tRNA threonylcarbamoyl adenosine modification protein (Sua5/YciO/YrdC/YwlC family)